MSRFGQQGSSHCHGRDFVGVCFALQAVRVYIFFIPTVFD